MEEKIRKGIKNHTYGAAAVWREERLQPEGVTSRRSKERDGGLTRGRGAGAPEWSRCDCCRTAALVMLP